VGDVGAVRQLQTLKPFIDVDVELNHTARRVASHLTGHAPPTTAPRPPVTVANPHIVRSLESKETHIQSHNRKKSGELWSTNYRVLDVSLDSPKLNFSGDYISALRGCWPLKFLHALEIDQGLLARTPNGDEGPPKKEFCLSSWTCGAGRPHVGLCPIFLVMSENIACPMCSGTVF